MPQALPPEPPPPAADQAKPTLRGSARPSPVAAEPALACGNCRQTMQRVGLDGRYGASVDVDVCRHCDLVWFDDTETARLSGTGVLALIGEMAEAYALPHELLHDKVVCPRCAGAVKVVHNQSRWGRCVQLQCVRRHGAYQSFAQFLQEKGLLRPMSRLDRARLLRDKGRIDCVNCGAAVGAGDELCPFCRSVPSLLDVARLARSLDPEQALEATPLHATPARQAAMQCAACGAALPPEDSMTCPQCQATLAIPSLADAYASVKALAPALRQHAEHPAPEIVKRRLGALAADLPRRREWAAEMEREARQRNHPGTEFEWSSLWRRETSPVRAALIAAALWIAWRYWY